MQILETSEGEKAVSGPVTSVAPAIPAKAVIAEAVTIRVSPTEITPGEVASIVVVSTEASIAEVSPAGTVVAEVAKATQAEIITAEVTTTRGTSTEIAPGEVTNTEVTTTVTSASLGNDHNNLSSDCFLFIYIIFDFYNLAETLALIALSVERPHEEVIVPSVVNPVGLDHLYNMEIQSYI